MVEQTWVRWALIGCWSVFAVVWIVGAVLKARAGLTERTRSSRQVVVGIAVAVLAVAVLEFVPERVWRPITLHASWAAPAGVAVLVVGTAFTLWARGVLGTMWASAVRVTEEHELRTGGPYRLVRHPIYTGLLMMMAGSVLATGFGSGLLLVLLAYGWIALKAHDEEVVLTAAFGADYDGYRDRVPRLLPGAKVFRHR